MKKSTTFKGAPKPYGKPGHYDEPVRHSLQAKGIHTGHLADKFLPMVVEKPVKAPEPISKEDVWQNEVVEALGLDPDTAGFKEDDGHWVVEDGDQEYLVFENEDDARDFAIERVKEDLEEEPELFEKNWLQGHIDMEQLKNTLEDDVEEFERGYFTDIQDEDDNEWQNRGVAELIKMGKLDEDDFRDEEGELKEITPELQQKIDDAVDEASEEATEEKMEDPIGYLEEIYPENEAMEKAIELGGIDYDEASEDAVDTDGVAHFLASYDGDEVQLSDGRVAYRTN